MAANKIQAPQRGRIVNQDGTPTLRVSNYFEEVSRVIESFTMDNITDASITAATVAQADATTAGATYVQAQVQSIVDLANADKAELNKVITDIGNMKDKINAILAEMQNVNLMT